MRSAHELPGGGAGLATPREPTPPRVWDFDELKLLRLLEQGAQAKATLRDASDRRSEIINRRGRIRASLEIQKAQFNGRVNAETERDFQFAGVALARIDAELELMRDRLLPVIEAARNCENWARSNGWSSTGARGSVDRPPAATGTAESAARDAASRDTIASQNWQLTRGC